MKIRQYAGSLAAIVIGVIFLFAGLGDLPKATNELTRLSGFDLSLSGIAMLLGACAYISAKRRRFGEAQGRALRIFLELFAVLLIGFLTFGRHDVKMAIATDPVPSFVIPVWCLLAYAYQFARALLTDTKLRLN